MDAINLTSKTKLQILRTTEDRQTSKEQIAKLVQELTAARPNQLCADCASKGFNVKSIFKKTKPNHLEVANEFIYFFIFLRR